MKSYGCCGIIIIDYRQENWNMVHTFELSKMISKAMFEEIQQQLSWDFYKKGIFLTMKYADYGFSAIRL